MTYIDEIVGKIEAMDFDAALELIEEHRAEHELEPEFISVQAMLCIMVEEYETACELLQNGINRHPKNADLMYNLGYVYQKMDKKSHALRHYKKAIKLSDDEAFITELELLCADIKSANEPENKKKICFISCVNDEDQYKEMLSFINKLIIPDGYQVECLPIRNASSMTEGYNKAMSESDAKYKVYLHQDVHILNKRFIFDILDIFQSDEEIGVIGMVGSKRVPPSCVWWDDPEKLGCLFDMLIGEKKLYRYGSMTTKYETASIVDGLLIATQYDIEWRDDLFNGWHFYDCSQCCEFRRQDYKVVIAGQLDENNSPTPWCLHNSIRPSLDNFGIYLEVFRKEYWDMLDFSISL